jgi:hypothetical protein
MNYNNKNLKKIIFFISIFFNHRSYAKTYYCIVDILAISFTNFKCKFFMELMFAFQNFLSHFFFKTYGTSCPMYRYLYFNLMLTYLV